MPFNYLFTSHTTIDINPLPPVYKLQTVSNYSQKHEKKLNDLQGLLSCPQKGRKTIRPGRIQIEIALFAPENIEKNEEDNEAREGKIATNTFPMRTARA
jgi:hypothetical protein